MLRHFLFDDVLADNRPIDDMSLSYANVISELVLVRDGMLSLTDSHFSAADAHCFIEFSVLFDWFFFLLYFKCK